MIYEFLRRRIGLILVLLLQFAACEAMANVKSVCNDISSIRYIQKEAQWGRIQSTPEQLLMTLLRLATALDAINYNNPQSPFAQTSANFMAMITKIDDIARAQSEGPKLGSKDLSRELSSMIKYLSDVEVFLKCRELGTPDVIEANKVLPQDEPSALGKAIDKASPMVLVTSFSITGLVLVGLLYGILKLMLFFDRSPRYMCHTPVLIVFETKCFFTHIEDINRDGAKIDTALRNGNVQGNKADWAELYFCGHKVLGRLMWENQYFTGIKFKRKIRNKLVKDILKDNRKPFEETDLVKNARSCFKQDCHLNCPKYQPPYIPPDKSEQAENTDQEITATEEDELVSADKNTASAET